MVFIIFAAFALFALILGYVLLAKRWKEPDAESIDPPLAEARELSNKLSRLATGLVVSKYCALVCNQIAEINIHFKRDVEKLAHEILIHEGEFFMNRADLFAGQIAESLTEHFSETLNSPDCEHCEARASELQKDAEIIIFDILVFRNA